MNEYGLFDDVYYRLFDVVYYGLFDYVCKFNYSLTNVSIYLLNYFLMYNVDKRCLKTFVRKTCCLNKCDNKVYFLWDLKNINCLLVIDL